MATQRSNGTAQLQTGTRLYGVLLFDETFDTSKYTTLHDYMSTAHGISFN